MRIQTFHISRRHFEKHIKYVNTRIHNRVHSHMRRARTNALYTGHTKALTHSISAQGLIAAICAHMQKAVGVDKELASSPAEADLNAKHVFRYEDHGV